ncbi:hypothetical protein [uncultured Flavobacterium sp.]|uniref:hypothetical protein n=1 Tax=uncultured Flavobacterium sp. TaxID=165435 RepID=UPI0025F28AA4|nr:hypothetical protein [uncultured Flavobacterium sp.]
MKHFLPALLLLALFGFKQKAIAQENKKEQIAKHLTDYFFLERENIHVHLNKNVFMSSEQVWFKGYVFHRKKNVPFFSTVNIYASLIDSEGKILDTQLVYGNIGSFSGNFKLNESFKSGRYYLQFYTNWMNNFTEDESAVYEIAIINKLEGAGTALAKADPSKINIAFHPEGGALVSDIPNTVGISVADCNDNPLAVSVATIADGTGKALMTVQLNKKGYGKFILPANATGCKAIITANGQKFEQPLPQPQPRGIALDVNNLQDKTIVKVKTNKYTTEALSGKPVFAVIHQDDQAIVYELNFTQGSTEQTLVIPSADMLDGINTLRILDNDLNELATRLMYKNPKSGLTVGLDKSKQSIDALTYNGKVNYANMNLSIAALPEATKTLYETNDIYGSLLLRPYIKGNKSIDGGYYLANPSKVKMYELDLFLLNQDIKYAWNAIRTNPPQHTYQFDMGLTLKGTLPKSAGDSKFAKVRLYSITSSLDAMADVDEKRDFYFNNVVIADSSYVNLTMIRKGEKPKELNIKPMITNAPRRFNKPFKPELRFYQQSDTADSLSVPAVYRETTLLDEVTIETTGLKYARNFGNGNLRAYKISDSQEYMYQSLLNYIKTYGGFNVTDSNGQVRLTSRTTNTINGATSGPIFYIDNMQQMDYSMMSMIQLSEVDEIYMSPHAIVPSVRNYMGIIRVYLKKGVKVNAKNTTPDIIMEKAFKKIAPFVNVQYTSTADKGFENFGVISWHPVVMTDENGNFELSLPKTGQKTMKVIIEGFSADGKLISEIKTIQVN